MSDKNITPWGMSKTSLPRRTLVWKSQAGHLSITLEKCTDVKQVEAQQLGISMGKKYVRNADRPPEHQESDADKNLEYLPTVDGEVVRISWDSAIIFALLTVTQPQDVKNRLSFEEFCGWYAVDPSIIDECLKVSNELSKKTTAAKKGSSTLQLQAFQKDQDTTQESFSERAQNDVPSTSASAL